MQTCRKHGDEIVVGHMSVYCPLCQALEEVKNLKSLIEGTRGEKPSGITLKKEEK